MSEYENPALRRLPDYVAGKSIDELARERGLRDIVKLASNENPLGPSPAALHAYRAAAEKLHLYPDNDCRSLTRAVASMLNVPESMLIFGTGSDDVMHLAAWAFGRPGTRALVPSPGFLGYPIFFRELWHPGASCSSGKRSMES
ncbi:MAG: aminotransferase class I/II-fold pyridoxal phosphate-dependent enzyme [Deltaproteobacteria bacterium]|nr:aminotransferase class I/II-fold pyridoxal phosphate-dependent enzyme [Deltaproteobacteria bacterium]